MCGGAKRLDIGSERYIEVFYGPDRDDEACPHPATCLPDEDWRWALAMNSHRLGDFGKYKNEQ